MDKNSKIIWNQRGCTGRSLINHTRKRTKRETRNINQFEAPMLTFSDELNFLRAKKGFKDITRILEKKVAKRMWLKINEERFKYVAMGSGLGTGKEKLIVNNCTQGKK